MDGDLERDELLGADVNVSRGEFEFVVGAIKKNVASALAMGTMVCLIIVAVCIAAPVWYMLVAGFLFWMMLVVAMDTVVIGKPNTLGIMFKKILPPVVDGARDS